jgi:hypothetical protein
MDHAWCHDTERDAAVRAAEDGRTKPLPTLDEPIANPFTDASERSVPVSKTGEGQSGMRTERVTLEITQFKNSGYKSPSEWDWDFFLRGEALTDGVSVRVVDAHAEKVAESVAWEGARDAYRGRILRLTEERDKAIRERDALRAARITQSLTADRFASAVQEADTLRARVAELEAKLAPHANAGGGSNHAAQTASGGGVQSNQPLADGGRPREESAESATAESSPSLSRALPVAPADGADPTASGGGEPQCVSSASCGSTTGDSGRDWHLASSGREPVAWMCEWTDHAELYGSKTQAERAAAGDVVPQPLYHQPPQPRGWLTGEEREAVDHAREAWKARAEVFRNSHDPASESVCESNAAILLNLLAGSSPPEVVLPMCIYEHGGDFWRGWMSCESAFRKALAAAGVAVKEVGRE